jgi:type II secretory pathway pseudopilin PulG
MIHGKLTRSGGFTLTELLVVIGIMVLLTAVMFPATYSLRRGNQVTQCSFRLQRIGMALRAYQIDYKGLPPVYILETTGPFDHSTVPADPLDEIKDAATEPFNNGLDALFQLGYLGNRRALHCPSDEDNIDPNNRAYYTSYSSRDEAAKCEVDPGDSNPLEMNRYKYMPCRTWNLFDPFVGDGQRQLSPRVTPVWIYDGASGQYRWAWAPVAGRLQPTTTSPHVWGPNDWAEDPTGVHWYPDDTTLITWCERHADGLVRWHDGESPSGSPLKLREHMYQALFWDGSVQLVPARLFTDEKYSDDTDVHPDAAWKVAPTDKLAVEE